MLAAGYLDGDIFEQGVPLHGRGRSAMQELLPNPPVGVIVSDHAVTEVSGEALVEPKILPIRRRHQVAEPLMSDLVGDHLADSFLPGFGGDARIVQQQVFTKGNGPPVLHGAEREVRDGDEIHLGQRIRDAVVGFAECQRFAAELQPEVGVFLGGGQREHPHAAVDRILQRFELAHAEEDQIGGHLGRGLENHAFFAAFEHFLRFDVGVGDGRQAAADHHFDVERRFAAGVVHARKGPAGITFLELGDGNVAAAAFVQVAAAVKPRHPIVDPAGIIDVQQNFARDGFRKLDAQLLAGRLHPVGAWNEIIAAPDAAGPDRKLGGVQNDLVGGIRQAEPDSSVAVEGESAQVGD